MAPRHTQGCGGRHIVRRRISRAQQTKNWCVGFSFPPPAYAGIHPTLYLFGFRASRALRRPSETLREASGSFRLGASGGLRQPPGLQRIAGLSLWVRTLSLVVGFASFLGCQPCSCLADPEISAFPGHLLETAGQWAPRTTPRKPRGQGLGLGLLIT